MVRQEVKAFKVLQEEEPVVVVKAHREVQDLKVDKDSLVHKVVKDL
jgi:hypothetical protein